MWTCELKHEDVVTVFGVPGIMDRVAGKVVKECKQECIVACVGFQVREWTERERRADVWYYHVGDVRREWEKRRRRVE